MSAHRYFMNMDTIIRWTAGVSMANYYIVITAPVFHGQTIE